MRAATTLHRDTQTFLIRICGPGLDDDRYRVERFQSMAAGEGPAQDEGRDRVPAGDPGEAARAQRDRRLRRARLKGGVWHWGDLATGLFVERKRG